MWIKQIRKKKLQSVLIFIIISLCSLLITGSLIILTSLNTPYHNLFEETHSADVKIYPAVKSEISGKDWNNYLSEIDCVDKVDEIKTFTTSYIIIDNVKEELFIDVCKLCDTYKNVRVLQGNLSDVQAGTCAVPSSFANEQNIEIGDVISIPNGDNKVSYKVVAIFADIYSMSSAFTSDILVSDISNYKDIHSVYAVKLKDGYSDSDLIDEYGQKNEGVMDGFFRTSEDSIENAALTEKILGGILLGISSVILLVILLIISYIVKNSMRKDTKNIAIYKSLGYSENHIETMYITFYQSIVFCGSVVGALSSVIVSSAFMRTAYKNLGITDASSDLWQKIVCIAFINLITFIMLLSEFKKIKKLKPVDILTGSNENLGIKKNKHRSKDISSFSPLSLALRKFSNEKKRSALIIITCVVSIYIVNISVVCLQNLKLIAGETNYYWLGIDNHDVTINDLSSNEKMDEICSKISEDDDVSLLVRKNYGVTLSIPYHQSVEACIFDSYKDFDMSTVKGRNPEYPDEITIGNIYLSELDLDIGDYINIKLDNNTEKRMLIVGSYQGFYNMGKGVRILSSTLKENNVPYTLDAASVILKEGADKQEFIDRIENKYGDYVTATDRQNLYSNIMDMICEPQSEALFPFVVITIIIGGVNLFYIIYSNNCDNRRKNTILKSIGYSASHILKTNLIYVGITALFSIALSIPLLIFVFPKIMVLAMSGFGFAEYNLAIKPLTVLLVNSGMLILFVLVTLLTGKELYRNNLNYIISE